MRGWPGGGEAASWLGALVVLFVLLLVALVALSAWRGAGLPVVRSQRRRPEDVLRERYARGAIGWAAYQEALENLLKDRYVRGELELAEYEERLKRLLHRGPPDEREVGAGLASRSLEQRSADADREAGG